MCTDYGQVETLVSDLSKLLETRDEADIVFIAGNDEFRAHSMVIAARCNLLKDEVRTHLQYSRCEPTGWTIKSQNRENILEICLPDVSHAAFEAVLEYLYTGKIVVSVDNAFDLYNIAIRIGVPRLMEITNHHLMVSLTVDSVLDLLQEALRRNFELITRDLIKYVADHCERVLNSETFLRASPAVILHIIKQEDLNASEVEIWNCIIRWAAVQSGIPRTKTVSTMSGMERQKVVEHMIQFMRPGGIRIMNIDTPTFAREVEPLGLLSTRETLLKYRFDATRDIAEFEQAFPAPCIDFLMRIRRQSFTYESTHPHACGVGEKVVVSLPSWAMKVRIEFDPHCILGQYAELKFFQDEACTKMLSILTDRRRGRWNKHMPQLSIPDGLTLHLPSNQFWFTFYAPGAFSAEWGYKFSVYPEPSR